MTKSHDFFQLFNQFLKASKSGRRKQKNGYAITKGTLEGYKNTRKLLAEYCLKKDFELRIIPTNRLNTRDYKREKNYWKRFYKDFTDFLYRDKGAYDNYVGYCIKPIRTFFRYISHEKNISIGDIYKEFFVPSESPQIITLQPDQFKFLINDANFHQELTKPQRQVKDIFVFGCTVALRYSDIMQVKATNLLDINGYNYLRVLSQKTKTETQVKLPGYALDIVLSYKRCKKYLFPQFHLATFNNHLKRIGEKAGWTQSVEKTREVRGVPKAIYKNARSREPYKFCDLMSSHMMRRTAITNMLMFGTDETVVRKISGHAPGSKEFFRYVAYAQAFTDEQTDRYFGLLQK